RSMFMQRSDTGYSTRARSGASSTSSPATTPSTATCFVFCTTQKTSFSRSIKRWRRGAVAWRDLSKPRECHLFRRHLSQRAASLLPTSTPQQWHRYCSIYLFRVPASAHTRLLVQKYQRPNCEGSSSERYSESTATISRLWGGQSVVRSTW